MAFDIQVVTKTKTEVRYLSAKCGVRYWEDATVNGKQDNDGEIPLRSGDYWCPTIDLATGIIDGWPKGTTASLHYKICDDGEYSLLSADREQVVKIEGYVPKIMSPGGAAYGDYVVMSIDGDGKIEDWKVTLSEFAQEDDD